MTAFRRCTDCAWDRHNGDRLERGITPGCALDKINEDGWKAYLWRIQMRQSGQHAAFQPPCPSWASVDALQHLSDALRDAAASADRLEHE